MARIKSTRRRKNIWRLILDKFHGGTTTLLDEARISTNQAKESVNMIQVQDGLWKPRWGTMYYGQAISGETEILGASEYIKSTGVREMIAVGGTGKVYKSTDGGTWTQITGATFASDNKPFFLQIDNIFLITNGSDPLTQYDGSTLSQYTEISAPTGVTATRGAGLSAGSYTYYYKITALNTVGETVGSSEANETVNKDRDTWSAATEVINLAWTAVTGASRYQIYISNETGQETLLWESATNSFSDDGSKTPNPYIIVPDDNTTGAPKFTQMEMSGNRIWGTRNADYPYRIYFSGVGQFVNYFSAYYGGGWVDLEKGGRETPQYVGHYRTGKGDSAATVLCKTPEGVGAIWQITIEAVTVGDSTFSVPIPVKVVGTIGADAPYGVVKVGDELMFLNKKGVFKLGSKEQIYNILSTAEVSSSIRPSYRSLNLASIDNFCGHWYDAKVFFSVTEGDGENDSIFIYDTERNNWNWKWDIGVRRFTEYTDNDNKTHFIGVPTNGNQLWEITEAVTSDLGQPFRTSYVSGLYPIGKSVRDFAKVKEAIVEIGRPKGQVTFEVIGIEKKKGFSSLASRTITDSVSTIDFTNTLWGDYMFGDDDAVPESYAQASVKKRLRINKVLNSIQFHIYSSAADTDYTILGIQAEGRGVPTRTPSEWNE